MTWQEIWQETLKEFFNLVKAPISAPELWWIITPLILVLIIMTFYFGKYIKEQLGWNTALSNSVVLIFIGLDLLKTIYNYSTPPTIWQYSWHPITTLIIFAIMFEGIMLSVTAFKHGLPEKIMFIITSPVSINVQAYVLTAVVYTQRIPTIYTVLAGIILYIILFATLRLIQEIEHLTFGYHFKRK